VRAVTDNALTAPDAGDRTIRGGSLRAAANITGVLTGAISAPLVVRHLGVEAYGKLALVNSIVFVATALSEGGLTQVALRRYASSEAGEQRVLIAALLGLRVALTAVVTVLALAFGVVAGYPEVVLVGISLGMVALLLNVIWGTQLTNLMARLRLTGVAAIEMLRALSTTVFLVVLVVIGAGLVPFYVVAPAAAAVTFAATTYAVRGHVPLRPRFDAERWRELLRETLLYGAATALGAIYFQLALVITSLLTTEHETGLYAIAFRIVELANGVPWVLATSVFPIFAHAAVNDEERLRYALGRVTDVCLLVGGFTTVGVMLGAPFGIDLVAGDEGAGAVDVLRLTAIGLIATYLVAAWSLLLASRGRFALLLKLNAAVFTLAIVLSLVLVPEFGAEGAGAVTATLEILLAVLYLWALRRELPGLRAGLTTVPKLLAALAVAAAVGVPLLSVSSALAAACGLVAYTAVVLVLRAVPPEVWQALQRVRA
jgi:O-antigen/teichoic acid export membrane protein